MEKYPYSDIIDQRYLICGIHVRKLATVVAFVLIGITLLGLPYNIYDSFTNDGSDMLRPKQPIFTLLLGYAIALAAPVCVVLADKKEKAILYLPQIVLAILNIIIFSIALFFGLVLIVILGSDTDKWLDDVQMSPTDKRHLREYGSIVFVFLVVVFIASIVMSICICKVMMRARRYMLDEVETGNVYRAPGYDVQKHIIA